MSDWFRVHFKTKQIIVHGQAELARIKARKVPKVILVEDAVVHTCSICGKQEAWLDSWSWFGSWTDLEEGKEIIKFCSELCKAAGPREDPRHAKEHHQKAVKHQHHRPWKIDQGGSSWGKRRDALQEANHRRFQMPEFPKERRGNGWCRWCGEEIIVRTGKNKGKRSHNRTFHRLKYGDPRGCDGEWACHTDRDAQHRFLLKRDGAGCAMCPPGAGRWIDGGHMRSWTRADAHWIHWSQTLEVDHVIPLWTIAYEEKTAAERLAMHGPGNLWLLCQDHHRWKSAIEAKERSEAMEAAKRP